MSGQLDRAAIAALRGELIGWRQRGVVELWVDLSALTVRDPNLTGLLARLLVWARSQLREWGGDLIVTGAGAWLRKELDTAATTLGTLSLSDQGRVRDRPHQPARRYYRPETADQP